MLLFAMPLPAPDEAVFGVDHFANSAEAALGEDTGRRVRFVKGVGAYERDVLGEGKARECLGRLGRVALAPMLGLNTVGDFDEAIRGWPFEAATPDIATSLTMHHGKAVTPRINRLRGPQRGEPIGRDLGTILWSHRIDHRESFFPGQ